MVEPPLVRSGQALSPGMPEAQSRTHASQLSELADDRASDPKVKDFAKQMVTDHTQANNELKPIAESNKIPVPTKLQSEHEVAYKRLEKLSGAKFDAGGSHGGGKACRPAFRGKDGWEHAVHASSKKGIGIGRQRGQSVRSFLRGY